MVCVPKSISGKGRVCKAGGPCPCVPGSKNSIAEIVDCYNTRKCSETEEEAFYKALPLKGAIAAAAMAVLPGNKKHPHQYRIPNITLKAWVKAIFAQECIIKSCKSFDELLSLLEAQRLKGIGALAIYDTALRIGFSKNFYPTLIYLHAGTAVGAAQVANIRGKQTLDRSELPPPFKALKPHEVEDCLCICKRQLQWLKNNGCPSRVAD
ncbi:hypothetical protein [Geobacter sp. SVR]|uniref:hypothetical protein n=1 Tax=Geobacter sp. SVR TaxID=2495594 RepID=UPI00143EF67D|nr:hypothetical protein [Geobacter sp. SVR]BCS54582.1 hypothetical protein GSVR_28900 [Geobacter sp. SVR]GCF86911.1 hypothetical protein GSbR_35110 [Geobacter sp. SVR]